MTTHNNTTHNTPNTITDNDKIDANIEYRYKIECYKSEIMDLVDLGRFYSARELLTKCIQEVSDFNR
jgi:hypothetical protein